MWMKEALVFLWLIRFTRMDLGGRNGGTRFCVNDQSPFFWLWLRVRIHIWFKGFHLDHQWLLWATFNNVVLGSLMELTPLPNVFLCLLIVLLCLRIRMVFLILSILSLCFVLRVGATFSLLLLWGVHRPKLSRLLFKLLLDFNSILIGCAQGWDVQKLHFILHVSIQTTTILKH